MAKNVSLFGRRELQAHRRLVSGMTAGIPAYKEVDRNGNKEWVVDVFVGAAEPTAVNVVKDCPIALYAKNLVTDIRQPVQLERSKQGKYTVVGRAKVVPSGTQLPDETILEPNYHEVKHNLADLRLLFVADLDYSLEPFQEDPDIVDGTPLQADEDEPLQVIRATDAFGRQVLGPEVDAPPLLDPEPARTTVTRHLLVEPAQFGEYGNPLAMRWGDEGSEFQPMIQRLVEHES